MPPDCDRGRECRDRRLGSQVAGWATILSAVVAVAAALLRVDGSQDGLPVALVSAAAGIVFGWVWELTRT